MSNNFLKYPNILIFSEEIPQTIHAGCILLYRLLKDYPSDKLLVIGPSALAKAQTLKCRYETFSPVGERLTRTRFDRLPRTLRAWSLLPYGSLQPLLKDFKPSVVVTVMQSQAYFLQAYKYAKANRLPLVLILHDDPEIFDRVYSFSKRRKKSINTCVYRYASKRLCISPEMAIHLEKVYGTSGDVLYPNPSEHITPRPLIECATLKKAPLLTIGYAGSLAYGYGHRLTQIIPALTKVGAQLYIYADPINSWTKSNEVSFRGKAEVPETTWEKMKQECDIVLLPYSFEDYEAHNLYRTHFPSKLPEYLSLQMPVIITGPDYATGVKWGINHPQAALTIATAKEEAFVKALQNVRQSPELRTSLAMNALKARNVDFDPAAIRERFYQFLDSAILTS